MKPTKSPKMKDIVTGFDGRVELTVYAEDGQVASRRLVLCGAIQGDTPVEVQRFLLQLAHRAEAAAAKGA